MGLEFSRIGIRKTTSTRTNDNGTNKTGSAVMKSKKSKKEERILVQMFHCMFHRGTKKYAF
jgi:hypothetical protein